MALPSYIINWEEMERLITDSMNKAYIPTINGFNYTTRVKGFKSFVHGLDNKNVMDWHLEKDIIIVSITYSQSSYRDEDYWELWINGVRPMKNMQSREIGETIHWMDIKELKEGDRIRFNHINNSMTEKYIWVDIEYMEIDNTHMDSNDEYIEDKCKYNFDVVNYKDLDILRVDLELFGSYKQTIDLTRDEGFKGYLEDIKASSNMISLGFDLDGQEPSFNVFSQGENEYLIRIDMRGVI